MGDLEFTFKTRWLGKSEWTSSGQMISSKENLTKLRDALESRGSIVIEHWILGGSRAPERRVFDRYEDLIEYLRENAVAGDIVDAWCLHDLINEKNRLVSGKCPNEDGLIPESGSY